MFHLINFTQITFSLSCFEPRHLFEQKPIVNMTPPAADGGRFVTSLTTDEQLLIRAQVARQLQMPDKEAELCKFFSQKTFAILKLFRVF